MVYYYQIQSPDNGKKWLNTHAPILRVIFRKQPEIWQPLKVAKSLKARADKSVALADYSDVDKFSKIKNSLNYRTNVVTKSYLANLLKDQTDFFPPTLIISNRKIVATSKKALWLYQKNIAGKYYLKPDNGFAGKGIVILAHPQDALKNPNFKNQTQRTTQVTHQFSIKKPPRSIPKQIGMSETYILQQGIQNLHLYPGDRKYEYRIWVLVAWQKSHSPGLKVYFYQDAVMRLTATAYDPRSFKAEGNITTSSIYYANKGIYKSDLLSRQEYFDEVFPQAQEISKYVMKLIRPDLEARGAQGFEVFGFDFLNQRYTPKVSEADPILEPEEETLEELEVPEVLANVSKLRPILIEINRHIGYYTYPPGVHAPWVTSANKDMMRDLIELIMVPMLKKHPLATEKNLWKQILEI